MQVDFRSLVLALSRSETLPELAETLAAGLAASRSVVLSRVWVVSIDRSELSLMGSAGTPSGGGSYRRLDGAFSRIGMGAGKIGGVAATGEPRIVRGVRGDEDWLANPAWSARQGVRAFLAYPLIAGDRGIVGVLAVFDRDVPTEAALIDLPFLAEIAAARIAQLRDLRPPFATSVPAQTGTEVAAGDGGAGGRGVVTRAEMRRIEKENIEAALARTGGKVFGAEGAAALLGMRPTTLASRIKALGIVRVR